MDKNNIIGFILIFGIMLLWMRVSAPTEAQLAEEQRLRDSTELAESRMNEGDNTTITAPSTTQTQTPVYSDNDSLANVQATGKFGAFAPAARGEEATSVLENEVMKVTFTNKGGKIKEVELKLHDKVLTDAEGVESKIPVKLMEDERNRFEYLLPINGKGSISTEDLFFTPQISDNTITLSAPTSTGGAFVQKYTLGADYDLDYEIQFQNLNGVLNPGADQLDLKWVNYLDKIEKNFGFEKFYSSVYYKEIDDSPSYCSCRGDDEEELEEQVKWVSNVNQFFNSTLVADNTFSKANLDVKMMEDKDEDLKKVTSNVSIPISGGSSSIGMKMFIGPNDYEKLEAFSDDLEYIIPYGTSVFGTINRWVIKPSFDFLYGIIGNKGLTILALTFILKMLLFPFTYKMIYSQQKMAALKPKLAKLKDKFKDDAQQQQVETMKMYREFGANPLGGCMPMVIQMPIWYAMFRFFPASIDFRQASFLWANDLSSYDVAALLPFEIPFYGAHISLFTILWAGTTVLYTFYNTKHMDMSVNPAMKYMQYFMPLMFLFFFNNYASGLTCYMFFSNFINIAQTLITKNFIIDNEKIKEELEAYKKKPKKKGGFQERLQKVLDEQKKLQEEQAKKKKK